MERMCSMCRQVKDETEFYYREKTHIYNCYCRNCNKLFQKDYKRIWRERKKSMEEENNNHIPRLD